MDGNILSLTACVIRSSGMFTIQGLLKYWSELKDIQDFRNCPLYRGCPMSGVPLYNEWPTCMAFLVNNKSCKLTYAVKTTHCQLCQVTNYLVVRAAGLVVSWFSHLVIVRGEGLGRRLRVHKTTWLALETHCCHHLWLPVWYLQYHSVAIMKARKAFSWEWCNWQRAKTKSQHFACLSTKHMINTWYVW